MGLSPEQFVQFQGQLQSFLSGFLPVLLVLIFIRQTPRFIKRILLSMYDYPSPSRSDLHAAEFDCMMQELKLKIAQEARDKARQEAQARAEAEYETWLGDLPPLEDVTEL